jgi:copper chaperone CopZ
METRYLKVQGMSCGHCVRAVSEALKGVDGVQVESVEIGTARLKLDPGKATMSAVIDAVMDAGYEADEGSG